MIRQVVTILIFFCSGAGAIAQSASSDINPESAKKEASNRALMLESSVASSSAAELQYWKQRTEENKLNQEAWVNYFKTSLFHFYPQRSRKLEATERQQLETLLKEIEHHLPQSYAYHFSTYLLEGKTPEGLTALKKAYDQNPATELVDDMLAKSVIEQEKSSVRQWSEKLRDAGIYNSAVTEYNQNVLNSIEKNGYLITYGSADTYPLIILQEVYGIRRDVRIICMEWMTHPLYQANVSGQLQLPEKDAGKARTDNEIVEFLLKAGNAFPVYLGLTLSEESYASCKANLYCTGLAFKFSSSPLANTKILAGNWKNFKKKYLLSGEAMNSNYILPLAIIKRTSDKEKERTEAADWLNRLAEKHPSTLLQKYR